MMKTMMSAATESPRLLTGGVLEAGWVITEYIPNHAEHVLRALVAPLRLGMGLFKPYSRIHQHPAVAGGVLLHPLELGQALG